MAYLRKRKSKKNRLLYYICDRDNGVEKCTRINAESSREAKIELAKLEERIRNEKRNPLFIRSPLFGDYVSEHYLTHSKNTKSTNTYEKDLSHIKALLTELETVRLEEINLEKIKQIQDKWIKDNKKPKTINNRLIVLSAILTDAFKNRFVLSKLDIPKLKIHKVLPSYFEKDELKQILMNARPFVRNFVEFLIHTGLRKGELEKLRWADIDLNLKTIRILQTKSFKPRVIPINETLEHLINKLKNESRPGQNYIFEGKDGKPYTDFYHALKRELKRLGLTGHVHKLRHTFASYLVQNDASIYSVQKLLGHASVNTTEIYAHLNQKNLDLTVNKLNYLGDKSGGD
jgi:integrase